MIDTMRIVLGFALAPLASGVLQSVIMLSPLSFSSIVMFSYPLALLFGIPGFLLARRKGWTSLKATVLAGAGLGLLASMLVNFFLDLPGFGLAAVAIGAALCAAHGAAVALAFWFIALRRG